MDGDSDDIDMELLGGEDFADRQAAFATAAEELRAAAAAATGAQGTAEHKCCEAAAALGVKRARSQDQGPERQEGRGASATTAAASTIGMADAKQFSQANIIDSD